MYNNIIFSNVFVNLLTDYISAKDCLNFAKVCKLFNRRIHNTNKYKLYMELHDDLMDSVYNKQTLNINRLFLDYKRDITFDSPCTLIKNFAKSYPILTCMCIILSPIIIPITAIVGCWTVISAKIETHKLKKRKYKKDKKYLLMLSCIDKKYIELTKELKQINNMNDNKCIHEMCSVGIVTCNNDIMELYNDEIKTLPEEYLFHLFNLSCMSGNIHTAQNLYDIIIEDTDKMHLLFDTLCENFIGCNNHKLLDHLKQTNHIISDKAVIMGFARSCIRNDVYTLLYLLDNYDVNIRMHDDWGFRKACRKGNYDIASVLAERCSNYVLSTSTNKQKGFQYKKLNDNIRLKWKIT